MKKADLVSAGVVTAFGLTLLFVIVPIWVERHEEGGYGLGSQVMPTTLAIIVTALGAIFFVTRFLEGRFGTGAVQADDLPSPISAANWRFLLLTSLFLIAMIALFAWVGYLVAGPLTIAGFMIAMGERRPVHIVLTSIVAAGVVWLFFWQLLGVPLP